jgi:hypothetical protein
LNAPRTSFADFKEFPVPTSAFALPRDTPVVRATTAASPSFAASMVSP